MICPCDRLSCQPPIMPTAYHANNQDAAFAYSKSAATLQPPIISKIKLCSRELRIVLNRVLHVLQDTQQQKLISFVHKMRNVFFAETLHTPLSSLDHAECCMGCRAFGRSDLPGCVCGRPLPGGHGPQQPQQAAPSLVGHNNTARRRRGEVYCRWHCHHADHFLTPVSNTQGCKAADVATAVSHTCHERRHAGQELQKCWQSLFATFASEVLHTI